MKIKQKFRKVMATLLSAAMVMTRCVGLDFGAITVEATNYSKQTWYITTGDDGTIQSVNFQFQTSDTAPGTWYLYLWDKKAFSIHSERQGSFLMIFTTEALPSNKSSLSFWSYIISRSKQMQ